MRHPRYASLDELLAPVTLSRLSGRSVTEVRRLPFVGGHSASGSRFLEIETNDGAGPRFVVKLSSPACDWIVRATADERGREVLAWETGLLDRLPPQIAHAVLACARDGSGWAILMRNVADALIPGDEFEHEPISEADHARYLDALAALHATFWEAAEVSTPSPALCRPWHLYTAFSPQTGQREADHPNPVVRCIREGWELFWTLVEPAVANLLRELLANPERLFAALARYPRTLVHGDPRIQNLGIVRQPQPRVVLLDWHFVGPGAPGVDLAWYLSANGFRLPVARETTIAWYRERLAARLGPRFDEQWWRPQLELSLLGQLVRSGWYMAWDSLRNADPLAREWQGEDLAWFVERAKAGAQWL